MGTSTHAQQCSVPKPVVADSVPAGPAGLPSEDRKGHTAVAEKEQHEHKQGEATRRARPRYAGARKRQQRTPKGLLE
eukprot:5657205-Alexandrium_andersonii.AAC.1